MAADAVSHQKESADEEGFMKIVGGKQEKNRELNIQTTSRRWMLSLLKVGLMSGLL